MKMIQTKRNVKGQDVTNAVKIGKALLYHADARDLDLDPIDMIFTDPPYGHNNNNGDLIHNWEGSLGRFKDKAEARPIANDGFEEANDLVRWLFSSAKELLRFGGCCCCCCCCCGGGGPDPQFARWSLWMDELLEFKQMVVWDKGPIGLGWHYRRSYETVLVGMKPGGPCKWYGNNKVENIIRPGFLGIKKIIPQKTDHPTPKPPNLAAHFIGLHSQPGDVVLDPFMGHGSTGVAAVTMGREFIGVELDKDHFDAACARIENAQRQQRLFV